jgi:hypothetical protein
MTWIESHEEIGDHWKTHKLALQLKCSVPTAVGHLHLLWHYTLKVAWRTGDLAMFPPDEIARASRYDGDPHTFISALQECGFMDGMKVHQWMQYAKHIVYQRLYNEKRKDKLQCKNTVKTLSLHRKKAATIPNLTIPNLKTKDIGTSKKPSFQKPTPEEVAAYCKERGRGVDPFKWHNYYAANGWHVGRNPMKDWRAAVRTWEKETKGPEEVVL